MKIHWDISEYDIQRVTDFINENQNPFVKNRIDRNINRQSILINNNAILKTIAMCLLTSQQRSGPNTPVAAFLRQNPFPLTEENLAENNNIEQHIREVLLQNNLNRYINKIPAFFTSNFKFLQNTNWDIFNNLESRLNQYSTKETERVIADNIADSLTGLGPKQARNFLQALGLTKYEVPIDSRITIWLQNFGFPITLSSKALQDKGYYHFVSDGIQILCKKANIYPCVLDAAIFSSFDTGQWNQENIVF